MVPQAQPKYMLLSGDSRGVYCQLDFLEGFEDTFKLYKGYSLAGEWPRKALFQMDPTAKKRIQLSDYLVNSNSSIVASKRLQDFILTAGVPNIEMLPVRILDHKKRVASEEYAIVHLVTTQDCIDVKHSGITWNNINPEQILSMQRLILDEAKIHPEAVLFRAKGLVDQIFIRRDFAAKLQSTNFTGFRVWELSDYAG